MGWDFFFGLNICMTIKIHSETRVGQLEQELNELRLLVAQMIRNQNELLNMVLDLQSQIDNK